MRLPGRTRTGLRGRRNRPDHGSTAESGIRVAVLCLFLAPSLVVASDQWIPASRASFLATRDAAFSCLRRNERAFAEQGHAADELTGYYQHFANRAYAPDGDLLALDDRDLRVAYVALKKLVVHCDSPERIGVDFGPPRSDLDRAGRYDEHSEILGIKAGDLARLRAGSARHPAILRFGVSLYHNVDSCPGSPVASTTPSSRIYMLPTSAEAEIRAAASAELSSYLVRHGLSRSAAVGKGGRGTTSVHAGERSWFVELRIPLDLSGSISRAGSRFTHVVDKGGRVLRENGRPVSFHPTELMLLHELGHVERISVGEAEHRLSETQRVLEEIGPSLEDLVRADAVLKRALGQPPTAAVEYRFKLPSKAGELDPGVVANFFRPLIALHGSPERALLSPEGLAFVLESFANEECP